MTADIVISPLLPLPVIVVPATIGLFLTVVALLRGAPGAIIRLAVLVVLVLALVNPRGVREERQKQPDIGLVVVDRSASQAIEQRPAQTDQALAWVHEKLSRFDSLEMRTVVVRDRTAAANGDQGTQLFTAINRGAGEIPPATAPTVTTDTEKLEVGQSQSFAIHEHEHDLEVESNTNGSGGSSPTPITTTSITPADNVSQIENRPFNYAVNYLIRATYQVPLAGNPFW